VLSKDIDDGSTQNPLAASFFALQNDRHLARQAGLLEQARNPVEEILKEDLVAGADYLVNVVFELIPAASDRLAGETSP
jgi:hypothetical protein